MSTSNPHELRRLLDEAPFVEALARALSGQDADDVAQTTWLQAMRGDPHSVRGPRQWLASAVRGVVHNMRRSRDRRCAHERAAARDDRVPSPVEWMVRQERRRELVQAVDALPEPQRAVVLLRYFEDLPPRRIAALLDVPVTTVSSRLRTAITSLRQALDQRHEGRRAWLPALVPGIGGEARRPAAWFAMATRAKFAAAVGVLLVALLALWSLAGPHGPAPHGLDGPAPPPVSSSEIQGDPSIPTPLARAQIATPESAVEAASGSLHIHVSYEEDGAPVADLLLIAGRAGANQWLNKRRVRTDASGSARLEGLAPGRWTISNSRNLNVFSRAEVAAGAETQLWVTLPPGTELAGVVVDRDDVPVAGAHIYTKFPVDLDAEHVATTGADGRFSLRACPRTCFIGARAEGYAASAMQLVQQKSGTKELRIVLAEPGGMVEGLVLGPEGQPIADAVVLVGEGLPSRIPGEGTAPLPAQARTGADGRFRAIGIRAGEQVVRVRAVHLAPWESTCVVQDHIATSMTVNLSAGMSCLGVVLAVDDTPLDGVLVEVGNSDSFAYATATTAADGAFWLEGLIPGEVELRGSDRFGTATAVVRGGAGETVRCTLRIVRGLELVGTLVTADGQSLAGVSIHASAESAADAGPWYAIDAVDAEGRFTVADCPEGRLLTLVARGQNIRDARLEHVDPRAGPIEFRVQALPSPSATIKGILVGAEGQPIPHAIVNAYGPDANRIGALTESSESGSFELGPLVPGKWLVAIDADDWPDATFDWRQVAAHTTWDLGTILLPRGGTVRVRVAGEGELRPRFAIGDPTLTRWASVGPSDDGYLSEPIAGGPHFLSVRGSGVARQLLPVEVRPGEETVLDVRIEAGHPQRFEFVTSGPLRVLHLLLHRGGERLVDTTYRASAERPVPGHWKCELAPGDYTLTATSETMSGRVQFRVDQGAETTVRVAIQ